MNIAQVNKSPQNKIMTRTVMKMAKRQKLLNGVI